MSLLSTALSRMVECTSTRFMSGSIYLELAILTGIFFRNRVRERTEGVGVVVPRPSLHHFVILFGRLGVTPGVSALAAPFACRYGERCVLTLCPKAVNSSPFPDISSIFLVLLCMFRMCVSHNSHNSQE